MLNAYPAPSAPTLNSILTENNPHFIVNNEIPHTNPIIIATIVSTSNIILPSMQQLESIHVDTSAPYIDNEITEREPSIISWIPATRFEILHMNINNRCNTGNIIIFLLLVLILLTFLIIHFYLLSQTSNSFSANNNTYSIYNYLNNTYDVNFTYDVNTDQYEPSYNGSYEPSYDSWFY